MALMVLFVLYAQHRQRWVGACDWYGYYEEARLLSQGRLSMPSEIDVARYPAAAPLGFSAMNGRIVPQYAPGFPLLLAAGMLVGVEYFVPALCATLFVGLMYLTLRRRVSEPCALLFSGVWAAFPVVVFGASGIMSDVPAALFLLACFHLLVDRDRPVASGLIFAFSVLIRPNNALFGLLLLPLFGSWRRLVRFALPAAMLGGVYGAYNWDLFGAPWRTGYSWMGQQFFLALFPHYFPWYAKEVLSRFTPVLLLSAGWALWVRKKQSLFLLAWFLLYWLLYSFFAGAGDAWWFSRYVLPGMVGLFILAVEGLEDLRLRFSKARPTWALAAWTCLVLIALGVAALSIQFLDREGLLRPNLAGKPFHDVAIDAGRALPKGSLVGSYEWSGALRLYGGLETFSLLNGSAADLVEASVKAGRPVYLLMEPSIVQNPAVVGLLARFDTEDRITIQGWGKMKALRVVGPRSGG